MGWIGLDIRFNVHSDQAVYSMFVVGASSNLGQPFRSRQKTWFGVGERIGFLATTFALKDHYRNCDKHSMKKNVLLNLQCFSEKIDSKYKYMRLEFQKVIIALIFEWVFPK